jgi:hypothetical protein
MCGLAVVGRAGSPATSDDAAPPLPSLSTAEDVRKRLHTVLDEAPESPAVDADTTDDLMCREEWSEEEEEEAGASAGSDFDDDRARRRTAGTGYTTDDLGDESDVSPSPLVGSGGRRRAQQQARSPPPTPLGQLSFASCRMHGWLRSDRLMAGGCVRGVAWRGSRRQEATSDER